MGAIRPALIDFKVLPATENDCLELAQVQSIAFDNAKKEIPGANIFVTMFGPSSEEGNEFRRHGLVEKMKNDPTVRIWKAVIQDGNNGKEKIIGWSLWHFFTEPKSVDLLKKDIPWPSTTNAEAANEFIGDAAVVRKRHMDDKRFGWLHSLATLPEYCGKGVGSALLRQGFSSAKELELMDFWVDAAPDGYELYKKFGFKDVETIPMAVSKYGGIGTAYIIGMRRTD